MRPVAVLLMALTTACANRSPHQDPGHLEPLPADSTSAAAGDVGTTTPLLEAHDPRLKEALDSTASPAPAAYRRVAAEYQRLGVMDTAHEYLARALTLAPEDPATLDAIARLWRDSGFPQLGLADAYRAIYFAPQSPVARNTLGTLFQAMGRRELARAEYERAIALDPDAAYAHNNLCYGWMLDGRTRAALAACQRALAIDPGMTAARNNLALAYAVAGDREAARTALAQAGDRASQLYNTGILHLARREYRDAVSAFVAAHVARPTLEAAATRAAQAARLARRAAE